MEFCFDYNVTVNQFKKRNWWEDYKKRECLYNFLETRGFSRYETLVKFNAVLLYPTRPVMSGSLLMGLANVINVGAFEFESFENDLSIIKEILDTLKRERVYKFNNIIEMSLISDLDDYEPDVNINLYEEYWCLYDILNYDLLPTQIVCVENLKRESCRNVTLLEGIQDFVGITAEDTQNTLNRLCKYGTYTYALMHIFFDKPKVKISELNNVVNQSLHNKPVNQAQSPSSNIKPPASSVPRLIYGHEPEFIWKGHAFRSEQEVRVAKALDNLGATFFPSAGCRITESDGRHTREVDFLVVIDGNVGILEVDSKQYHDAEKDAIRDENFNSGGVKFIKRYSYQKCLNAQNVAIDFIVSMKSFYGRLPSVGYAGGGIEIDDQDQLVCPVCGSSYLHASRVEVFNKSEGGKFFNHVSVDIEDKSDIVTEDSDMSGNPSGRRDGTLINFWCEECHSEPILGIAQNKGNTIIYWQPIE